MLSTSKIKEVSQNSFVFDVVELDKVRKSRRIAPFSSLKIDKFTKIDNYIYNYHYTTLLSTNANANILRYITLH